jgi:hypothetical protein
MMRGSAKQSTVLENLLVLLEKIQCVFIGKKKCLLCPYFIMPLELVPDLLAKPRVQNKNTYFDVAALTHVLGGHIDISWVDYPYTASTMQ